MNTLGRVKKQGLIFLGLLLGCCAMAEKVSTEDLKAYYEQQKLLIKPTFKAPAPETVLTLVTLEGEEHEGELTQLTSSGVQVISGDELLTFRRRELDEQTCAKLFAEDFAHAEAIKNTRAYKNEMANKVPVVHKASLSVKSSNKQSSSDLGMESTERTGGIMEKSEKAFSKVVNLKVSGANRTDHPDKYSLKWYFFVQEIGTDRVAIHSSGSEQINLQGREKFQRTIASKPYNSKKKTSSWLSCPTCSTSDTKETGSESQGYLVLLKCGDEILAKQASSKRYLHIDWLKMVQ